MWSGRGARIWAGRDMDPWAAGSTYEVTSMLQLEVSGVRQWLY